MRSYTFASDQQCSTLKITLALVGSVAGSSAVRASKFKRLVNLRVEVCATAMSSKSPTRVFEVRKAAELKQLI